MFLFHSVDHLSNHVVENSSVAEISEFDVRVKANQHLERFARVELQPEKERKEGIREMENM